MHRCLWTLSLREVLQHVKEFCLDKEKELEEGRVQLKGNKIPKGLASVENLFDRHDRFVNKKLPSLLIVQDIISV